MSTTLLIVLVVVILCIASFVAGIYFERRNPQIAPKL